MERPPFLSRTTSDMLHPFSHRRHVSLSHLETLNFHHDDGTEKVGERDIQRSDISPSRTPQQYAQAFASSAWSLAPSPRNYSFSFTAFLRNFFIALVPSFFLSRAGGHVSPGKLHPTAHLDGMRGLAAFCVFICHMSYSVYTITRGFGQGEPGENAYLIQLPVVRLFYAGPPMVAIFFVISGYALSYKPLKQMRARQYESLLKTVSSATFRRGLRLYLPCAASTLIVLVAARIGLYEYTRPIQENKELFRAVEEYHQVRFDTLSEQLWDWGYRFFDFVHPWDWFIWGGSISYDLHLWTIPTEFRASMVLFLTHLGVARLRTAVRLICLFTLVWWALRWDRWEMILFWSGCILAELDLIKIARQPPPLLSPHQSKAESASGLQQSRAWKYFWFANFFCACYLASYPDEEAETTPGFQLLASWIPLYYSEKMRFWQSIGAIQIIWATNNCVALQRVFTTALVQYLGKLSFSLYLMHGLIIHTFGYTVMEIMWTLTGTDTRLNFDMGFFFAAIYIIVAVIWAADVFERLADNPSVKFARWLETKCTVAMS